MKKDEKSSSAGTTDQTLSEAFEEAGKRNKYDDGSYDLCRIDAFVAGAKIAIQLKEDGKSPLVDVDEMVEGYRWAINKLDIS